jgi:hypothetical protein
MIQMDGAMMDEQDDSGLDPIIDERETWPPTDHIDCRGHLSLYGTPVQR